VKVPKIHLSRKLMLVLGGVLVTLGGTGAAAVYIGADKLLGPSYAELNGLECTEVTSVEIHKKDRFWVRTFVTTDEPGDGLARVKTALRVAKAVQEKKKADLVQVVVLDTNGPKDRSGMRGRAVGADVVYVPDPAHVPEEVSARVFTARYVEGLAAPNGQFFGDRIDMLEADIEGLVAKLNDQADCMKADVAVPDGGGHGAPAAGHGEKAAEGDGHGAPADGHGEAPAEGHGDAPAGEHGEETPVAEHGAEESKGWMASVMGMVGLGGSDAPADGHGTVADGHDAPAEEHVEPAAVAHGDGRTEPVMDHAAPEEAHGKEAVAVATHAESSEHGEHGEQQAAHEAAEEPVTGVEAAGHDAAVEHGASVEKAVGHEPTTEEAPASQGGWLDSLKGMVGLGASEEEAVAEDVVAKTEEPQGADAGASTDHGAAWLEQMRAQPISPDAAGAAAAPAKAEEHGGATDHAPVGEQHVSKPVAPAVQQHAAPAEDEAILPPKAKAKGDEHAKADH
jgi:hypothetical protein